MNQSIEMARDYLKILDPTTDSFTFQTFDDVKDRKDGRLAQIRHGTIDTCYPWLVEMNNLGAGIFVMVQAGDGLGRKTNNVQRIRCVFHENDHGWTIRSPLFPQLVVQTSPGRTHEYFLCDLPVDEFTAVEARLIKDYGSDPNAKDLTRVLRVPGFFHNKNPDSPFLVNVALNMPLPHYSRVQIINAFPPYLNGHAKKDAFISDEPVEITPERISDVDAALNVLHPDAVGYAEWVATGLRLKSLGDAGYLLWVKWSQRSAKFDLDEINAKWPGFKPARTGYQAIFTKAQETGWVNPAITRAAEKRIDVGAVKWNNAQPPRPPGLRKRSLDEYAIVDYLEMKKDIQECVFVMEGLARRGDITIFYAKPSTGKTLLTVKLLIDSVRDGRIDGTRIYYINDDDEEAGFIYKGENFFAPNGIKQLKTGVNGFKASELTSIMLDMVDDNTARGAVVILDTVKKFTEVMDKKIASAFMQCCRVFTGAGGTIIGLAHTNKRRDDHGRLIAGGTSDIVDDASCAYTIDEITSTDPCYKNVLFSNFKMRGGVVREVAYRYSNQEGASYSALIASIEKLDGKTATSLAQSKSIDEQLEKDKDLIEAIADAIKLEINSTVALTDYVMDNDLFSKAKIRDCLTRYTGTSYTAGKRWYKLDLRHNNEKQYFLLDVNS